MIWVYIWIYSCTGFRYMQSKYYLICKNRKKLFRIFFIFSYFASFHFFFLQETLCVAQLQDDFVKHPNRDGVHPGSQGQAIYHNSVNARTIWKRLVQRICVPNTYAYKRCTFYGSRDTKVKVWGQGVHTNRLTNRPKTAHRQHIIRSGGVSKDQLHFGWNLRRLSVLIMAIRITDGISDRC